MSDEQNNVAVYHLRDWAFPGEGIFPLANITDSVGNISCLRHSDPSCTGAAVVMLVASGGEQITCLSAGRVQCAWQFQFHGSGNREGLASSPCHPHHRLRGQMCAHLRIIRLYVHTSDRDWTTSQLSRGIQISESRPRDMWWSWCELISICILQMYVCNEWYANVKRTLILEMSHLKL